MGTYYVIQAMHKLIGVSYHKEAAMNLAKRESLKNPKVHYDVCKIDERVKNGRKV